MTKELLRQQNDIHEETQVLPPTLSTEEDMIGLCNDILKTNLGCIFNNQLRGIDMLLQKMYQYKFMVLLSPIFRIYGPEN